MVRCAFDIFLGIEHKMRRVEMKEQFNKEAKQGWRLAADAARITDVTASSEDRSRFQTKANNNGDGCKRQDDF